MASVLLKPESKMSKVMKKIEKWNMYEHSNFKGHGGAVWSIVSSQDNSRIFSGSDDHSIIVWDSVSEKEIFRLQGHTNAVNALVLTKNDEYLISGSWDNSIKVWDWKNAQEVLNLDGHTAGVYCFAMSKDAKTLISGAGDGTARIWDLEQLMQIGLLDCVGNSVFGLALTSDEQTVLTGGWDATIRVWELSTRNLLSTLPGGAGIIQSLLVTADMKYIVFGTRNNIVKVWEYKDKKEVMNVTSHNNWVRNLVSTNDSKYVITCSADKTMRILNMVELVEEFNLEGHEGYIFGLCLTKDGRYLLSGASDKTVRRWEIGIRPRRNDLIGHQSSVLSVCMSKDQKFIISGSQDNTVRIWSIESQQETACLKGHAGIVWAVCALNDFKHVISGSDDKTLRIWDIESQTELSCLQEHNDSIFTLDVSPNNLTVVSSGKEKILIVWDLHDKGLKGKLEGHTDTVFSVKIMNDNVHAVSGSADYTIRVWNLTLLKQLNIIKTNCGMIECICFSHDESILAIADRKNTVHLWDFVHSQKIDMLTGHTGWVKCIAFGKNNILGSCSVDGTIKIWDYKQKILLRTLKAHSGGVRTIIFTKESNCVVSGSDDKTIMIWKMSNVRDLETNDHISTLDSFIFLTKLKNKIISSKFMINQTLSSLEVNLAHIYCYLDEDVLLKKAFDMNIQIYRDKEGNSPLFYALERKSQKCIDVFLKNLVGIHKTSLDNFVKICKAIKQDFFKLLKFPNLKIHEFLDLILHPVQSSSLPKFGYPKESLPIVKFIEQDVVSPELYLSKNGSSKELQPICFKSLPFKICLDTGSVDSIRFLKIICASENLELSQTNLVKSVVLYKWKTMWKYFFMYSLFHWLNLMLVLAVVLDLTRSTAPLLFTFLVINALFLIFELMKIYSLALSSYLKLSSGIEILRIFLCFLWCSCKILDKSYQGIEWMMIISTFLRGLTGFKAFDSTRFFVPLIYSVLMDSIGFIMLYIYSSLALWMLLSTTSSNNHWNIFQSPYELSIGKNLDASDWLIYWYFIFASIFNIIFMLNMLITIVGDGHHRFVFENCEGASYAKAGIIFEFESAMVWKKSIRRKGYIQVCEKYVKESEFHEWKGREKAVAYAITSAHQDNNNNFYALQVKLDELTQFNTSFERIHTKINKLIKAKK